MMKIRIGICDDQQPQVEILENYLQKYQGLHQIKIIKSYDGADFLKQLKKQSIDIAFLDIEMNDLNGIQVGAEIRNLYPETLLIYITGFKDYALEAFQLESFQYLIKPITPQQFDRTITRAIQRLKERRDYLKRATAFTIRNKNQILTIPLEDIFYFESQRKKIFAVTSNGVYEFVASMKSIMDSLASENFIRCHHGYIVNSQKIWEIRDSIIFFRDLKAQIPVSRRYKGKVIEALEKNLFEDR